MVGLPRVWVDELKEDRLSPGRQRYQIVLVLVRTNDAEKGKILKLQSLLFLNPSYSERIAIVNVIAENDYLKVDYTGQVGLIG